MRILIIFFVLALHLQSSFGQCLVHPKYIDEHIEGTYIMHTEINNSNAETTKLSLDQGVYNIYILNPSHNLSEYSILFESANSAINTSPIMRDESYSKYKFVLHTANEINVSLKANGSIKACAILAVYKLPNSFDEVLQYAKSKKGAPSGMVRISENLYYDKTEITNIGWREYTSWNKMTYGNNSAKYINSLPDTTIWTKLSKVNEPYTRFYFWHPAYSNYPVVGISYQQALSYCKWRSDQVNENMTQKEDYIFEFRLPTREDWMRVANIELSEKDAKKLQKCGCPSSNLRTNKKLKDGSLVPAPVDSYLPNEIGLYNLFGNLAEMTNQDGIALGGSYIHKKEEAGINDIIEYKSPQIWLGFRCICEKVDKR